MLICHLKFGDLDSASDMVLEMLRKAKEATNSLASVKYMINAAEIDHSHSPGLASVHSLNNNKDLR